MHSSRLVVIGLQFVDSGELVEWLKEQAPPSELLEILADLRALRARARSEVVASAELSPLLESLLGHPWLDGRWMPEAAHVELAEADDLWLHYRSSGVEPAE